MNNQNDDTLGLPEDEDDYEDEDADEYYRKQNARMEAHFDDPSNAGAVYVHDKHSPSDIRPGENVLASEEDKYDTGKLQIPTVEQQIAELEELRKNPDTYPREEILEEFEDEKRAKPKINYTPYTLSERYIQNYV